MEIALSKCRDDGCKRDIDTICTHCQGNFCSKHYIEHVKLANNELPSLVDQLNSMINTIQQLDPIDQALQQLEQWRERQHRYVDNLCTIKKQALKIEVSQKMETQMNKLRQLSQQVKELIDEGDASIKLIENVKKDIEECQKRYKEFETTNYIRFRLKSVQFDIEKVLTNNGLLQSGGTLLSFVHQVKLNRFYGTIGQKWKLIYKATRDGFSGADFHRCADNQGPTMILIQSKDGGHLFGGYTSVPWRSKGDWVEDKNGAYVFTLANPHGIPPTNYPVTSPGSSIYDHKDYGPSFGDSRDLCEFSNSQSTTNNNFYFSTSYNNITQRGSASFTGDINFETTEIEVFRLM